MKVADADEAVRFANDLPYGLAASVFTRRRVRGQQIEARVDSGTVNVNNVMTNVFQLPAPGAAVAAPASGGPSGANPQVLPGIEERFNLKSELYWYLSSGVRSRLMGPPGPTARREGLAQATWTLIRPP